MAEHDFGGYQRTRTACSAGAWTAIGIPQGARNGLLSMEDSTTSWRVTADNADALTSGHYITPASFFQVEGTSTAAVTVYVNPSASTTAFLSYTTEL